MTSPSTPITDQAEEPTLREVFNKAAEFGSALAGTLERMLKQDLKDATTLEKAAIQGFDELAEKFGAVGKVLDKVEVTQDLINLGKDLINGDEFGFEDEFAKAVFDGSKFWVARGVDAVAAPLGPFGVLLLDQLVVNPTLDQLKNPYNNLIAPGLKSAARSLFQALPHGGNTVFLNGGVSYYPGEGDPPPALILINADNGAAGPQNLSLTTEQVFGRSRPSSRESSPRSSIPRVTRTWAPITHTSPGAMAISRMVE